MGGSFQVPARESNRRPPALLVRLDPTPRVRIIASDWYAEEFARPLAVLVEHVLRAALSRGAGTA